MLIAPNKEKIVELDGVIITTGKHTRLGFKVTPPAAGAFSFFAYYAPSDISHPPEKEIAIAHWSYTWKEIFTYITPLDKYYEIKFDGEEAGATRLDVNPVFTVQ